MTVPHDSVLCLGLGLAAHLAVAEDRPLSGPERKVASLGFAAGWLPLSTTLLTVWPDWSWWYWEPVLGSTGVAAGLGLALECAAFGVGLGVGALLGRRAILGVLAALGVLYAALVVVPWGSFSHVGTSQDFEGGRATSLFRSTTLLVVMGVGSLWLAAVGLGTVRKLRTPKASASSDPGTSEAHPG